MAKKQLAAAQGQIKELEEKLRQHEASLKSTEETLNEERNTLKSTKKEKEDLERRAQSLQNTTQELQNSTQFLRTSKLSLERELSEAKNSKKELGDDRKRVEEELKKVEEELNRTKNEVATREAKLKTFEKDVKSRDEKTASLMSEKERLMSEKERLSAELRKQLEDAKKANEEIRKSMELEQQAHEEQLRQKAAKEKEPLIDVEISGCEFAKAFPYFLTVQLGNAEKRRTDISPPSDRPSFAKSCFLLPDVEAKDLTICAFCVVNPCGQGEGSARELGTAMISVEGPLTMRNVNFVRTSGDKTVTVGRASVTITRRERGDDVITPPIPIQPSESPQEEGLDKSLWMAHRFQCRLRVMLHHASAVPATFGKSFASVIIRLLRFDGSIAYENCSLDVPLSASEPLTVVSFNHEVVLPIKAPNLKEQRAQIVLQCNSKESSINELLNMSFFLSALQFLHPVHVHAQPSPGRTSSHARPLPSLAFSLTLEPLHHHVAPNKHPVEVRVDGVPLSRPLPDPVCDAIIAICPNFDMRSKESSCGVPKIPISTYNYDTKHDLTTHLEEHMEDLVREGIIDHPYFMTPLVNHGRTPSWGHFIIRLQLEAERLHAIGVFLFDKSPTRHNPGDPFSDVLVGFSSLDLTPLVRSKEAPTNKAGDMGETLQRTFMCDLRLMEAPTASASLELDCRVWPLEDGSAVATRDSGIGFGGGSSLAAASAPRHGHGMSNQGGEKNGPFLAASSGGDPRSVLAQAGAHTILNASSASAPFSSSSVEPPPADPDFPGPSAHTTSSLMGLHNASKEFQLNHDLSVQLMKEFNLRAGSLKQAGQEIVDLRRQVQLLTNENNKLRMQIEDEERLAEQIRKNPPTHDTSMFDSLNSAELSLRLQTALQKYRDEKTKSYEMTQRLEAALKEVARGRGLQKHLDELEKAHLEMAGFLQKVQTENQKIDLYRKTAKSQEKVIAKLERVLEGSLDEVNKAQEAQIELERLKTENIRMREKCSNLVTRRKFEVGNEDVQELQEDVRKKGEEVKRLQALVDDLSMQSGPKPVKSAKLDELEGEKLEWKQKCGAMENRLKTMELQLIENSKQYGRELSTLKVQIAKKDSLILQLQIRLDEDPVPK